MNAQAFLQQVLAIEAEKPSYRLGGSGKDGTCDCIGLVMGALRRAGGTWTGIHGSNWAARHEVDDLRWTTSELHPGEVVFKSRKPWEAGYDLPSRYAGDADDNDYYHVGVVYSTSPLVIIHCTGPGVIRDKKLGAWKYVARLKQVTLDGNAVSDQQDDKQDAQPKDQPGSGTILWRGRVKTSKGRGISLWDSSAKKWARKRVPDGAVVAVMSKADGKGFALAQYEGVQGMADTRYLVRTDAGEEDTSSKALRYTVTIRHLEENAANTLMATYAGAEIEVEET